MNRRAMIIERITAERERQSNLPGLEFDGHNSPNEWLAIIAHYLFAEVRRGQVKPDRAGFEDSLTKAAAVILAALEHGDRMTRYFDAQTTAASS